MPFFFKRATVVASLVTFCGLSVLLSSCGGAVGPHP